MVLSTKFCIATPGRGAGYIFTTIDLMRINFEERTFYQLDELSHTVALVGIGRRFVQLFRSESVVIEQDEEDPVAEALQRDPKQWDVETIRVLLESGDSQARRKALGWVISTPDLTEEKAREVTAVFIDFFSHEQGLESRVSLRALREIHHDYPTIVAGELAVIVTGLSAYHAGIRRETGQLVAKILEVQPELAGAVFPYLDGSEREHRQSALECLLRAARMQPAVMFPIQPAIEREIERGYVAEYLIAECIAILAESDPRFDSTLLHLLLARFPTEDPRLRLPAVTALTTRSDWPEELIVQGVPIVLTALGNGQVQDSQQACRWLDALAVSAPPIAEQFEEWGSQSSLPTRRRVAVTVHESMGTISRGILEQLALENDPILADLFETATHSESSRSDN